MESLPLRAPPAADLKALDVLHYCCYSSPLIFPSPHPSSCLHHIHITLASYCPLTAAPFPNISSVPPIKSPCSGVTVPLCLVALASFVLFVWLSFSHLGLSKSPFPLACCPLVIRIHVFSYFFFLLSPFLPPRPVTYGSALSSAAQGIPRAHRSEWHPRPAQPTDADTDAQHRAVDQREAKGGQGWRVTDYRAGAEGGQTSRRIRVQEVRSRWQTSVRGVKDDDITWKAEEGEGEPGRVRVTDERWGTLCMCADRVLMCPSPLSHGCSSTSMHECL